MKVVDLSKKHAHAVAFDNMERGKVYRTNDLVGIFYMRCDEGRAVRIDSTGIGRTGGLVLEKSFDCQTMFYEVDATLTVTGDKLYD